MSEKQPNQLSAMTPLQCIIFVLRFADPLITFAVMMALVITIATSHITNSLFRWMSQLANEEDGPETSSTMERYLLLYILCTVTGQTAQLCLRRSRAKQSMLFEVRYEAWIMEKLTTADPLLIDRTDLNELQGKCSIGIWNVKNIYWFTSDIIQIFFDAVSYLWNIYMLSGGAAISFALAALASYVYYFASSDEEKRKKRKERNEKRNKLNMKIHNEYRNMLFNCLHAREETRINVGRYSEQSAKLRHENASEGESTETSQCLLETLVLLAFAFGGSSYSPYRDITVKAGDMLLNLNFVTQLAQSFKHIGDCCRCFMTELADIRSFFEIFEEIAEGRDTLPPQKKWGGLVLKNITWTHFPRKKKEEEDKAAVKRKEKTFKLDHLELPLGATIRVTGENGAFKTTLLKIIGGVYHNEQLDMRCYTEDCTTLFQDSDLLNQVSGTWLEFVSNENQRPDSNLILQLLDDLYLREFLDSNYSGATSQERLNCEIGKLSGGEQTRVIMAKVLYTMIKRNSGLLILDEFEKGLSATIRVPVLQRVLERLQNGKRTILIVSHADIPANFFTQVVHLSMPAPDSDISQLD
jgi:ABC-type Mn2+/Zn2+ transport system ATPase subunit